MVQVPGAMYCRYRYIVSYNMKLAACFRRKLLIKTRHRKFFQGCLCGVEMRFAAGRRDRTAVRRFTLLATDSHGCGCDDVVVRLCVGLLLLLLVLGSDSVDCPAVGPPLTLGLVSP